MANYCPNCGASVSSGDLYCASCGASLSGSGISGSNSSSNAGMGSAAAAGAAGALGTLVAVTLASGLTRRMYYYGGRYFWDPYCRRPYMGGFIGAPRPVRPMGPAGKPPMHGPGRGPGGFGGPGGRGPGGGAHGGRR